MTLLIDIVGELGALASLHPAGAMNRAPTNSTSLRSSFFWQFDSSILIMGIADEYIGMLYRTIVRASITIGRYQ